MSHSGGMHLQLNLAEMMERSLVAIDKALLSERSTPSQRVARGEQAVIVTIRQKIEIRTIPSPTSRLSKRPTTKPAAAPYVG